MTSTIATAKKTPITVAYGDGIGPEIMDATLRIITEAGAQLDIERIDIGEAIYNRGLQSGIEPESWESLRRTKVFLKAPITTPQGGGFKSLNVTVRKTLGMYANVRPCASLAPVRCDEASEDGPGHRSRERGRRLRRHRAPSNRASHAVPEAHLAPRQRTHHSLRVRIRARATNAKKSRASPKTTS